MGNNIQPSKEVLEALRKVQIEILLECDRVCKEMGIKYSLYAGTLLGAVRHKGFIPWDDDVDICMLREDYDKFVTQGQALMSNEFHILTHKSGQNFPCSSCKVDKKGTECVTANTLDPQKSRRYGIGIDIFPINKVSSNPIIRKIDRRCLHWLIRIFNDTLFYGRAYRKKNLFKQCVASLCHYIGKLLTVRRVCRLITKVYTKNKNSHLVYVCLSGVTHKANRIPLDVFKSYTTMSFEGYQFPVIKDYDTYLTAKYGDYMELPPEGQRVTHGIIDVKFGKNFSL